MPDIYLDVDVAMTEVPVNLLPLIDATDYKTIEDAVAYDAAGLALVWNFITTTGVFTQTAVTPTTGGDYDWVHQGDGMYTIEIPVSGGASVNNDAEGFGWFTGVATGILPWRGPVICFRAAGLNDALIDNAYSTTRGLAGTALPNAAAESSGGLYTRGSGAGQIAQDANGRVNVNVAAIETADPTDTIRDAVVDDATRIDASALNTLSGHDPGETIMGATDTVVLTDGSLTAAKIDADAITAAKVAADVTTELQSGLATASALSTVDGKIDTIDTNVDTLLARISSTLFAGITSLAEWLGLIAGKQTGNATARTELRATGAGSGAFDETTDSQEAIRDNMGTAQTGDAFARLGAPAGASVSADIAAIEGQTDDIGVAGAGLTAVPWNPAWDAEVQSEVQDAIEANHLDHLLATTYDPASKPGAADALLNELVESDAGVARYTANALEQAPTGGSAPSAADIADAVWEEVIADHSGTAGSTAESLNAAGSAGDPWVTALPGAYGAGSAGKILGDNLNATVSSRASQTSVDDLPTNAELTTALDDLPTAAENASQVRTELTTELGRIDAAVSTRATPAQVATELATYDGPTKAEMDAALAAADDAVLAAIAALNNLSAAGVRTALGMASANLDTQLAALPTATENADALLTRDFTAVTGEAARSALNALRFLRNRWAIAGGTLTVFGEDDTTSKWTGAVTQTAGNPVSTIDPS